MLGFSSETQISSSAPRSVTPHRSASIRETKLVYSEFMFQLRKYLTLPHSSLMWFLMREREMFLSVPLRSLTVSLINRYH